MFVLPQILLAGEKITERASFEVSVPLKTESAEGLVRVDGYIQGQINGTITGEVHALVRGDVNAVVTIGKISEEESDNECKEV